MEQDNKDKLDILFFGKKECPYSEEALNYLKQKNTNVTIVLSENRFDKVPSEILNWVGDYILSFNNYIIIPQKLISKAKKRAINFHPAPPKYPGSGSANLALFNDDENFGVTAHQLVAEIDSGEIIEVSYFPIKENYNVKTLLNEAHNELLVLFKKIVSLLVKNDKKILDMLYKENNHEWNGPARKIKEIDKFQKISPTLTEKEIMKHIRSFHTKNFPIYIELHGLKFYLENKIDGIDY